MKMPISQHPQKWEPANKDETETNKGKVINLDVKFKSNANGVIGEIADCGNVDTDVLGETLAVQPEELSEGDFRDVDEESSGDEKSEASQRNCCRQNTSH